MQLQRKAFVSPPSFILPSVRKTNGVCYRSPRRLTCCDFNVAAASNSPARVPSDLSPESSKLEAPANHQSFIKELQEAHNGLRSSHPPDHHSILIFLSSFRDECLTIQEKINRSLPGMSHLDRAIDAAGDDQITSQQLARLMRPTGALRTLCGAASAVRYRLGVETPLHSVASGTHVSTPLRAASEVVARHALLHLRGSASLRNFSWRALQFETLRAHPSFCELPETAAVNVTTTDQLQLLSQDGKAFLHSRNVFPVRADSVWRILGFGEDVAVARLGDLLPEAYRGHAHALEAWQAFFREPSSLDRSFAEEYQVCHIPNAVFSYLEAAKDQFDRDFSGRARWVSPIQIQETGLCIAKAGGHQPITAAPIGRVLRRRKEDFWAWGPHEDMLLLVHSEMPFSGDGPGSDFRIAKARKRLDVVSFLEAQVSMLVCGEQYRGADVVWHGVLGGTTTFRVWRDERLIELVVREVESFCELFVGERPRPPGRCFAGGEAHVELMERVKDGCDRVEMAFEVGAEVDEMRMERYREGMTEWERGKKEKPFHRAKRDRG